MKRKELILVIAIALMAGIGIGLFLAKDATSRNTSTEKNADDGVAKVEPIVQKSHTSADGEEVQPKKERRRRHRADVSSEESENGNGDGANQMMDFSTDFGGLVRNWLAEEGEEGSGRSFAKQDKDKVLEEVFKVVDKFRNGTEKERNDIKAGSAMLQLILTGMTQDIKKNPPEISVSRRQEILDNAAETEELFNDLEAEIKDFDDEEKRIFGNTVRVMRGFANAIKEAAER